MVENLQPAIQLAPQARMPHPSRALRWAGRGISAHAHRKHEPATTNNGQLSLDNDSGFTLLELLIVMVIIATLAAMAIPAYTHVVLAAREAVLKEDLRVMRSAIDSYTVDKAQAPQSLQDLVTGGYLKEIPKDPMTNRTDTWMTSTSDTLSTIDETQGGIDDVHSGSQAVSSDGTTYNTW